MAKNKKKKDSMISFVGIGFLLLGIAVIAMELFLKTDEGKNLNAMSIDELKREMAKHIESEHYEKAALIRDLIKQKQTA